MSAPSLLQRTRQTALLYTPAALMTLLALGSWWLVRSNPLPAPPPPPAAAMKSVDWGMENFITTGYDAQGQMQDELRGSHLVHFNTSEMLIQAPRMLKHDRQGALIRAQAQNASGTDDARDVTLIGQVQIERTLGADQLQIQGPRIRITGKGERMLAQDPVLLTRQQHQITAGSMDYNAKTGIALLGQRVHSIFRPQ